MKTTHESASRPPIALIVDDQEWSSRALESLLAPSGYAVMRAYTSASGLARAQTHPPDVIFVSATLPDGSGEDLCRRLRQEPAIGASVPVFATSPERLPRDERIAVLAAGACDVLSFPLDSQELLLRLDTAVRAKMDRDAVAEQGLMDEATGLYNLKGLQTRARELRALAYRHGQAMACVVLAPMARTEGADEEPPSHLAQVAVLLAAELRRTGRVSDAIGRFGPNAFAVITPGTGRSGVLGLAERLDAVLRRLEEAGGEHPFEIVAGYDAVENVREAPAEANELLVHAATALRHARSNGNGGWIQPYKPPPRPK